MRWGLIAGWMVLAACSAALYIHYGLAAAADGPDLYARTWQFQLVAFGLVRFPLLIVGLIAALILQQRLRSAGSSRTGSGMSIRL